MTYERFLKIGLQLEKQDKIVLGLYKKKVDLIEFVEPYNVIIQELLTEIYGKEGYDWFSWFCYEADYGKKDYSKGFVCQTNSDGTIEFLERDDIKWGAQDENGNPICYSWESLYEYLETNHRNK